MVGPVMAVQSYEHSKASLSVAVNVCDVGVTEEPVPQLELVTIRPPSTEVVV